MNVALITGAGSGLGRRWAERLAQAGTRVAALDRNAAGLAALAAAVPNVTPHVVDVTDLGELRRIVDEVERTCGPIDRVVHAAGIMPGSPLLEQDPELTKRVMRINYEGTVNVVHAALPPLLARRRGQFVCFGSIAGEALTPRLGAYCASKAAVNAYVEVLAHEHRDSGVTIHVTCPSTVDTPMLSQSIETGGPSSIQRAIDEKMVATPDQIIDAVERALVRRASKSHPLPIAKVLHALRRVSPKLLWTIIERSEASTTARQASAG